MISIPVNVKNPTEFFGCLGLLELAMRVSGEAKGSFSNDETHFEIETTASLSQLLQVLCETPITETGTESLQFGSYLTLDWWHNNSPLAVWSGCVRPQNFLPLAQKQLLGQLPTSDPLGLTVISPTGSGMTTLDARIRNDARDIGFSHDKLAAKAKQPRRQYPGALLLAFLGLQRCHPSKDLRYATWTKPLPPALVQTATWGLLPGFVHRQYLFQVHKYIPGRCFALITFADRV